MNKVFEFRPPAGNAKALAVVCILQGSYDIKLIKLSVRTCVCVCVARACMI